MTEIRQIISIVKNFNKEGREGETEGKKEREIERGIGGREQGAFLSSYNL